MHPCSLYNPTTTKYFDGQPVPCLLATTYNLLLIFFSCRHKSKPKPPGSSLQQFMDTPFLDIKGPILKSLDQRPFALSQSHFLQPSRPFPRLQSWADQTCLFVVSFGSFITQRSFLRLLVWDDIYCKFYY